MLFRSPGAVERPLDDAARAAIREYQASVKLAQTGAPTFGLLRSLREAGGLKPWGTIAYSRANEKWGISWNHATRKEAVRSALRSCGDAGGCTAELSFYGPECGAFAHWDRGWSLASVARRCFGWLARRPSVSRGSFSVFSSAFNTASSQPLWPLDLSSLRSTMVPSGAHFTSTSAVGLPTTSSVKVMLGLTLRSEEHTLNSSHT